MDDLIRYSACPTCGCREFSVLAPVEQLEKEKAFRDELYRRGFPDTPESMLDDLTVFTNSYPARLVVCHDCGLVCRDPRFSTSGSVQAYARDEYSDEWLESTFAEYYASYSRRMPELKRIIGEHARVLEVGNYVGGFLAAATDSGWTAQGVDVGQRVGEYSRSKGLEVFTGTLFDAHLPDSTFNAVFVWLCFDQLPEPRKTLDEIRRLLTPGGWLFLQIPNGDHIKWMEPLARGPLRRAACKALAYTGMAGFPYQLGYTPAVLTALLTQTRFTNVVIRNQMDVCDESSPSERQIAEQTRYVRFVHRSSELLSRFSAGRLLKSPWLLVTCQRV